MSTSMIGAPRKIVAMTKYLIDGDGFRDVVVVCPRCKAMETVSLNHEGMVPTRRFTQRADVVYHSCGSDVPCRLYSLN